MMVSAFPVTNPFDGLLAKIGESMLSNLPHMLSTGVTIPGSDQMFGHFTPIHAGIKPQFDNIDSLLESMYLVSSTKPFWMASPAAWTFNWWLAELVSSPSNINQHHDEHDVY